MTKTKRIGESALRDLLGHMTSAEKIAQMTQLDEIYLGGQKTVTTGPVKDLAIPTGVGAAMGSVLGSSGAAHNRRIQTDYLRGARLKIPLLFMTDVIHGLRTIFPIPLAIGCSFDPPLAEESARIAAIEASASGLHVTFSPMCDFVRDPRWGRVMESGGECAWLNGLIAAAMVRGYQGDDLSGTTSIASCAKHFAGYGAVEGGREYNTVDLSERTLRDRHLPAFQAAVDAGCSLVMPAFTLIDGIPAPGSAWLLRTILREEMGFGGVTVSDWGSVAELVLHGVAADSAAAAAMSLRAGIDIEIMSACYTNHLALQLDSGTVDLDLVDEAVLRILRLKDTLGLFVDPFHGSDEQVEKEVVFCEAHRDFSREMASRCMVLLKNDDVLPIPPEVGRVAVIGPFAESTNLLGGWSCDGRSEECTSLVEAVRSRIGKERVLSVPACDFEGDEIDLKKAVAAASSADIVVLAVGEPVGMSGEAASRADPTLPGRQQELCDAVIATGKPCVVVLFNGRPLVMPRLARMAPAILEAWFPGTSGGTSVTDVLFGDREPKGRLSMSFPAAVGQIPVYHDALRTGRPKTGGPEDYYQSGYLDLPNEPVFPFGHGLSYTTFSVGTPTLDRDSLFQDAAGEVLMLSVAVTNTGFRTGSELLQLYVRDLVGSVSRPVLELKGFERVTLPPGETTCVSFRIDETMLRFHDDRMRFVAEPGRFLAWVGQSSACLSEPVAFELRTRDEVLQGRKEEP